MKDKEIMQRLEEIKKSNERTVKVGKEFAKLKTEIDNHFKRPLKLIESHVQESNAKKTPQS